MARKRKSDEENSLRWDCKNAVPNIEKLRGCSWSMFFIPVDGWDAEPTIINNGFDSNRMPIPPARSYYVKNCPYFEKG